MAATEASRLAAPRRPRPRQRRPAQEPNGEFHGGGLPTCELERGTVLRCHVPVKHGRAWRYVAFAVLGLSVLVVALVLTFLWVRPRPSEFILGGLASDMGKAYGKKARWHLWALNRAYIERTVCQNDRELIQARHKTASAQLPNWPEPYVAELGAMTQSAGLTTGALAYANCFLDLGQVKAGCRSVVIETNGLFLHAHNLDWDSLAGLGRWTTSIVRRNPGDGRFRTVSVGFPGLVGSLDIVNEKGLALSFNQLGISKGATNEPRFIMIRRIAETCATFAEARQEILTAPRGMPFIITVSDAKARTGAVFEAERDTVMERPLIGGWVSACNVSQGPGKPETPLDRLLDSTPIKSPMDLQEALRDDRVLLASNLYSVIFDFEHNLMLLASGSVPAATAPYREFRLFK